MIAHDERIVRTEIAHDAPALVEIAAGARTAA